MSGAREKLHPASNIRYRRALNNLALVLIRSGRYDDGLLVCNRLDRECGERPDAMAHLWCVHLRREEWRDQETGDSFRENGKLGTQLTGQRAFLDAVP